MINQKETGYERFSLFLAKMLVEGKVRVTQDQYGLLRIDMEHLNLTFSDVVKEKHGIELCTKYLIDQINREFQVFAPMEGSLDMHLQLLEKDGEIKKLEKHNESLTKEISKLSRKLSRYENFLKSHSSKCDNFLNTEKRSR